MQRYILFGKLSVGGGNILSRVLPNIIDISYQEKFLDKQKIKKKIIYLLFNILILIIAMEKKFYVAPSVEIVEVAVEAGFAQSMDVNEW